VFCLQLSHSSDNTVTLREVNLQGTGDYRCEVSGEAPSFQTDFKKAHMIVVGKLMILILIFLLVPYLHIATFSCLTCLNWLDIFRYQNNITSDDNLQYNRKTI